MEEMLSSVEKYGIGVVATVIIFISFLYYVREMLKTQREHNKTQTDALGKVSDSNDNVAEALKLIRDMFVDRTNTIEHKQNLTLNVLQTHCSDMGRIEATINKMQDSVIKTEERTKVCSDHKQKYQEGG